MRSLIALYLSTAVSFCYCSDTLMLWSYWIYLLDALYTRSLNLRVSCCWLFTCMNFISSNKLAPVEPTDSILEYVLLLCISAWEVFYLCGLTLCIHVHLYAYMHSWWCSCNVGTTNGIGWCECELLWGYIICMCIIWYEYILRFFNDVRQNQTHYSE